MPTPYLARLTAPCPSRRLDDPTADDLAAAFEALPLDLARLDAESAEEAGHLRPLGAVADAKWPELATIRAKLAGPGINAQFLALLM